MVKFMFLGPFNRLMPEEDSDGYWVVDGAGKRVKDLVDLTPVKSSKMNYAVLINDVRHEQTYLLQDGDEVNILPLFVAG